MRKILITISIIYILCFSINVSAQFPVSDSLENVTKNYIKKYRSPNKQTYVVARFYSLLDKYVIYIEPRSNKLCKENDGIYKIQNIDGSINAYFFNDFMTSIKLNEENIRFFLTDEECEENKGTIFETMIVMLLVDHKFSIEKEVKGINYNSLKEELLCPTSPASVERARVRKKYGKL